MGLALEGSEWEGVDVLPVKGRSATIFKQTLSFDGYRTLDVDRSWTKGHEVTVGWTHGIPTDPFYRKIITTDIIDKKQTFYFTLADDVGLQSQAFCATRFSARDFNIGHSDVSAFNLLLDLAGPGIESSNVFFSRFYVGQSLAPWDLYLDNQAAMRHPKHYVGYLAKSEHEYYSIVPSSRVKTKKGKVGNMPFGAGGFEIRNQEGHPVAAVSLIDQGIVYLKDTDPQESLLLATLCAALLMQESAL